MRRLRDPHAAIKAILKRDIKGTLTRIRRRAAWERGADAVRSQLEHEAAGTDLATVVVGDTKKKAGRRRRRAKPAPPAAQVLPFSKDHDR